MDFFCQENEVHLLGYHCALFYVFRVRVAPLTMNIATCHCYFLTKFTLKCRYYQLSPVRQGTASSSQSGLDEGGCLAAHPPWHVVEASLSPTELDAAQVLWSPAGSFFGSAFLISYDRGNEFLAEYDQRRSGPVESNLPPTEIGGAPVRWTQT